MPIKLKANNGNIDLQVPIKNGAVSSVNGQVGDVVLDIPNKTSDLVNDSGFLTQHQDISGLATKSEVKSVEDKIPSLDNYATKDELFSKDYNDLTNKPTIPSIDGLATKSEVKAVEDKIPSLEGYATEQWVEAKGYLTEHQSLENYAFRSEIPTKTSDLTNDSGFLTEHQSLAAYALKSEIPTVPTNVSALTNDSGYLTLATLPKYDGGVE